MVNQIREILVNCGKLLLAWAILVGLFGTFLLLMIPHIGRELFLGVWALVFRAATRQDVVRRFPQQSPRRETPSGPRRQNSQ